MTDPATIAPTVAPIADPLAAAMATIRRGTEFFARGSAGADGRALAGRSRTRRTGNGLRELDRFLNLLIDAAVTARGGVPRPDETNTAAKYRRTAPAGPAMAADHRRLLALGRSRACLFYCDGIVRRPDRRGGAAMTTGWAGADGELRVLPLGQELHLGTDDLGDVARFYQRLATRIAATAVL